MNEVRCPKHIPPICLLSGGVLEIILFSIGKIYGYLGIIFLIIGAWILWRGDASQTLQEKEGKNE